MRQKVWTVVNANEVKKEITRCSLPKINEMLEWGVVKGRDTIVANAKEPVE